MSDEQKGIRCQAFFNYSVVLPDEDEQEQEKEVLIMGNFIIENMGEDTLNIPVVCIKIKPAHSGMLGGKIEATPRSEMIVDATNSLEWQYLNQNFKEKAKESGEYWLRPKESNELKPGEKLFFSNFDLKLNKPQEKNSVIVEGFIYFKELQQGIPALNKIIINF
ncbi:hypothetical protein [Alkalihalobacterium elongatum]|uniref:hypothetical protein n=1 Tax=Alkalihalobacterium elongatum TaxID=2675466 RepID=UPI001C1F68C7|nr:hypothetical protein [Alkalihalobacterium elongatum]